MLFIKQIVTNIILCLSLFIFYACSHIQTSPAHADSKYFDSLQKMLIQDGFDKTRIKKIYSDSRIKFNTSGVSAYFVHQESRANYDQFTETEPIQRALNYMERYENELINAEKAYGVDRRIITAIILVETNFGTYLGKRSVLSTLSTMAALTDPGVKEMLWNRVADTTDLTKEEFEAKADKKSEWAYNELKAFLEYTDKEVTDPFEIQGSFAGAMGICQFMPSNILTLAKDGNNDGRINLFNHADAIMSVASYLKHYGWYPGIDRNGAYNAVYTYNHSSYYVNTILKIAELLTEG